MTILQALKDANKQAGILTELKLANIQEFQSFMNSFRFEQYPINIIVPYSTNGQDTGPQRKATLVLEGWILTQIHGDPNDYRSMELEQKYIAPMRKLAIKFLRSFYKSDVIDAEAKVITDTISPEYQFLNSLTFGVSYKANVPIVESACVGNDVDTESGNCL